MGQHVENRCDDTVVHAGMEIGLLGDQCDPLAPSAGVRDGHAGRDPGALAIVLAAITQLLTVPANGMTPRGRPCNRRSACSSQAAKKPSKSMYSCSGLVGFRNRAPWRI